MKNFVVICPSHQECRTEKWHPQCRHSIPHRLNHPVGCQTRCTATFAPKTVFRCQPLPNIVQVRDERELP